MEYYRTLDLTILSANRLKNARNMNVYAVASIYDSSKVQKFKTPVHKDGGSGPVWNYTMKFTVNETAAFKNRLTLVVKIKSPRLFMDKNMGQVRVPIKDLLEGTVNMLSYPVKGRDGDLKGVLSLSYKFGEKTVSARSVYRPRVVRVRGASAHAIASSSNGFGLGFVSGLAISDVASSAGGGGGGCGGGGCGGCS